MPSMTPLRAVRPPRLIPATGLRTPLEGTKVCPKSVLRYGMRIVSSIEAFLPVAFLLPQRNNDVDIPGKTELGSRDA